MTSAVTRVLEKTTVVFHLWNAPMEWNGMDQSCGYTNSISIFTYQTDALKLTINTLEGRCIQ